MRKLATALKRLLADAELEKAPLKEISRGSLSLERRRVAVHHLIWNVNHK